MKTMLLLFLTISLSSTTYAAIGDYSAPSSDQSLTTQKTGQQEAYEGGSDVIVSSQSSTARETARDTETKDTDWSKRSCRTSDGTWLRAGDMGYAACMDDADLTKR